MSDEVEGAPGELTVLPKNRRSKRLDRFDLGDQLDDLEVLLDPTASRTWPVRGVNVGFSQLSAAFDGYRNRLYCFAGGSRMGKSTLLLQHAYDLLRMDETARVLFVSLEQPARDVNLRLVAMAGRCKIDYLVDPRPEEEEQYDRKKLRGLRKVQTFKDRLWVVDESQGFLDLDEVRAMVRQLRDEGEGPLFLLLDPIFKLRNREVPFAAPLDERVGYLATELNTLAMQEQVGVLFTTRLDRGAGSERPTLMDLEGQSNLLYEVEAVCLVYCDAPNDPNTPFLEWEWGTDDMMVPIYEIEVAKNRMGEFSGRLFYRFYPSFSMFKECSRLEIDNFNRMLQNLRRHGDDEEAKEPDLPRVEDVSAT